MPWVASRVAANLVRRPRASDDPIFESPRVILLTTGSDVTHIGQGLQYTPHLVWGKTEITKARGDGSEAPP